ncbi:MAG: hypothetical protein H0U79_03540 [Solirubrobacterales bacterium]|nr:hypothetical protein [Solirubrobacterales bacterium]
MAVYGLRRRDVLAMYAVTFVGVAAFPKLAHRLRWPTRLSPRGRAAYVLCHAAWLFALQTWALPYLKSKAEQYEHDKAQLAERLGRQPGGHELAELFGHARDR